MTQDENDELSDTDTLAPTIFTSLEQLGTKVAICRKLWTSLLLPLSLKQ